MDADGASPIFAAPAAGTELEFELSVTGRGGAQYRSTDSVLILGVSSTGVAVTSDPISTETYYVGEVIELTLTFDRAVVADTTGGTPSIELVLGDGLRRAHYVRGGGMRQLVFAYVVQEDDHDEDGIRICGAGDAVDDLVDDLGCPGAISLNGGSFEYQSGLTALLRHPGQADQAGHRVDGSRMGLRGGICGRTKEVRDALVRLIGSADCSQVTVADLGGLTGTLSLQKAGIDTLKPGDFAGLGTLETLDLNGNVLVALLEGVFNGLGALKTLSLADNVLMKELPASVFAGLSELETLRLSRNGLTTLPVGVFNGLGALKILYLYSNSLMALPAGVFNGLRALESLQLNINGSLKELPKGLFADLIALKILTLNHNGLEHLPVGLFSDLVALETLFLNNNHLTTLDAGVFSGLVTLKTLILNHNGLVTLPAGLFNDLPALETLHLNNNGLQTLTAGIFSSLRALRYLYLDGNPGSGSFRPIANAGADQAVEVGQSFTLSARARSTDPWGDNVVYAWRQTDSSGHALELGDVATASISFVVPATPTELEFELSVLGHGDDYYRSVDSVLILGVLSTSVAVTSDPVASDTYHVGEVIELTLTFDRPVLANITGGTPSIKLVLGDRTRRAHYVRGGGTRQLVFAYTVEPGDRDNNGIRICGDGAPVDNPGNDPVDELGCAGAIILNGGSLEYRPGLTALLRHPGQADQADHRVDGSQTGLRGGICGRTREVRDELVRLIGVADCSAVTTADLQGLTGTLSLQGAGIDTLKLGDFSGLSALEALHLGENLLQALDADLFVGLSKLKRLSLHFNSLTELPAGVFNGLGRLTNLILNHNSLTALPAGLFMGSAKLELLTLNCNGLTALPAGIFSELLVLEFLVLLNDNSSNCPNYGPGGQSFLPIADAGVDQVAEAGQIVTLRATASSTDPWGDNVEYAWRQSDSSGTVLDLGDANTASISFVVPAVATELEFELVVTGSGQDPRPNIFNYIDTDRVTVRSVIPDTVVTLLDPEPEITTAITEEALTLVYTYSADNLHGRALSNSIEVAAAVDGVAVSADIRVDESSGIGEIAIVLRREAYPGPGEYQLAVTLSLSDTAEDFVLGKPNSITTPFSFGTKMVPENTFVAVTLAGPQPTETTAIVGELLTLVYTYSADDLRGRSLESNIEVAAAVDGISIMPTVHYIDGISGEVTIILDRDEYPGPDEHQLAVTLNLSATAEGFVLGDPHSITTPFNFLRGPMAPVPDTVVTLSGSASLAVKEIAGGALSLVFVYSAADLQGRTLTGKIEVEVEVDGTAIPMFGHYVDEGRGRGEITVALRRVDYLANSTHELRIALSTTAENFVLGVPSSLTIPFNFTLISTAIASDGTCRLGMLAPGGSCRYRGTTYTLRVMESGAQVSFFDLSEIGEPMILRDYPNPLNMSDANLYNLKAIRVGQGYRIIRIYDPPYDNLLDGETGSVDVAAILLAVLPLFANLLGLVEGGRRRRLSRGRRVV